MMMIMLQVMHIRTDVLLARYFLRRRLVLVAGRVLSQCATSYIIIIITDHLL